MVLTLVAAWACVHVGYDWGSPFMSRALLNKDTRHKRLTDTSCIYECGGDTANGTVDSREHWILSPREPERNSGFILLDDVKSCGV